MNRHALEVLQFGEALDVVARFASSSLGAEHIRALEPSDAHLQITDDLRRVDQTVGLLLRAEDFVIGTIPDLRAALRRLGVAGSVLEGPMLRDTGELLRTARAARRAVLRYADDFPLVSEVAERLGRLDAEAERLAAAIDEAGDVRDGASRELGSLRREIRGARGRIVQKLEQYVAKLPARFQVPDASVTIREGRYVIPVRREGRSEVGGLVHDESATGATLYVEPPVALELMNRLRELELAEAREVLRILRELTDRLRPHAASLTETLEALVELDSLYARGRYALECNGRRPEILPAGERGYRVVEGYHPLLMAGPERVVPFDLDMDDAERTLLISGPNTGGKTVLLKAVGLLSALAQAGVIPPCGAGTRFPIFTDIFADIGDEQSIEASLSTFAAHLKNLREILDDATPSSLVLIDEMGSGTDPAEGGALARAILVELNRRGTRTFATTHLGQLKLLAGEEPGVVNASLQFDAVELRPTFRLQKGIPGRSYGLAIARRLGFPADLLGLAEACLPAGERDVGHLLLELERKEREAEESLQEANVARREALELRRRVEAKEHEIGQRERDAERRARQQARDLLLAARQEVEDVVRELREAAAGAQDTAQLDEAIGRARRRVETRARRQAERTPTTQPASGAADERPLEVGGRVRIEATGAEGVVVELRDDRAMVETGGIRLQVPARGLVAIAGSTQARKRTRPAGGWTSPDVDASPEVDLRGMRAEEVAGPLARALDAAIQTGLPSLRIIHGKGTGALREIVSELLRADPRIASFRAGGVGEGGTGVTVAELG